MYCLGQQLYNRLYPRYDANQHRKQQRAKCLCQGFHLLGEGTHHALSGIKFSGIGADNASGMCLVYQRQITEIGLLCFGCFLDIDIQTMICRGFCQGGFHDGKTSTTDWLDLAGDGRCDGLGSILKGLISIVGSGPDIVGQLGIAQRHLADILTCHAEAGQHLCVQGAVLHKLLHVDTHFLVKALNPLVGFLGLRAETSAETGSDTVPFNSLGSNVRYDLNRLLYPLDSLLDDVDEAGKVYPRAVHILAHLPDTITGVPRARVDAS